MSEAQVLPSQPAMLDGTAPAQAFDANAMVSPPMSFPSPATTNSSSSAGTSLYVGELDPTVTEAMLYEIFSMSGHVGSIRVCRDAVTRRSLGYAYVNYLNPGDGERALETLNYSLIKGKPCRIMWSQRDPSLRKTSSGNIFIKNLDEAIDNKALHDTFAAFGPILSCKIAFDEHGRSKGYGFVHYESHESSDAAIKAVNGMSLNDKVVFVGPHIPKKERQAKIDEVRSRFTNLYIKEIAEDATDAQFRELFERFGPVTSAVISREDDGKSKGFGFVNYEDHESARNAVEDLHRKDWLGKELYVTRAQKKGEREEELRKSYEQQKYEKTLKYQGVNLYIKNVDDDWDDQKLEAEFAQFGTITSTKIMRDEKGNSKGFGFVCFSSPDEATKAVTELNGKMLGTKPLYVSLAQRKDIRKQQLEQQVAQRNQLRNHQLAIASGIPGMANPMYPSGPMYYPPNAYPQGGRGGMMGFPQPMAMPRGAYPPNPSGRGGQLPGMPMPTPYGFPGYGPVPPIGAQGQPQPPQGQNKNRPPRNNANGTTNGPNRNQAQPQTNGTAPSTSATGPKPTNVPPQANNKPGYPAKPVTKNIPDQQVGVIPTPQVPAVNSPTAALLSQAPVTDHKQILGETLYPRIADMQPEFAGKITGMLLEMDNQELIVLADDNNALSAKVREAMAVLEEYSKRPE